MLRGMSVRKSEFPAWLLILSLSCHSLRDCAQLRRRPHGAWPPHLQGRERHQQEPEGQGTVGTQAWTMVIMIMLGSTEHDQ